MLKHLVISRLWFDNIQLMDRYIDIALKTFIPSLKAQSCKDFDFGILVRKEHVSHVRKRIGIRFIPYTGGIEQFRGVAHKEGYTIQTRHDFDDWMAPGYIAEIQKIYKTNIHRYKSFVIFAQPVRMDYPSGKISKVAPYHEKRISMFATLCQRDPVHPIYKGSHGQLYQYAEKIFKLPDGMARWVQHKDSVTTARLKKKIRSGNELVIRKVGSMELYDIDHNWISERNMKPVLNVLTRTFKRPNSFKICRESILSQTYSNINHIVGSEVECPYYPKAVKLIKKEGKLLPWNLHLNDLGARVKTGWVMYLDDDDKFMTKTSAQEIMDEIENEDQLLIWKVQISTWTAPNDKHFGKIIKKGQVSGIGILFHSKHLPVPWKAQPAGDYYVIKYLSEKLEVKWVNKILTGTQAGKNHHGAVPDIEKKPVKKLEIKQEPLVSVGTPTWNNKDIYWLSIESLCRQETTYPWELIVHECPSSNPLGEKYFAQYRERLKKSGCQRVVYINKGRRTNLSTKWIEIAKAAKGEVLILHDSDDYTHPLRIQKTMELIGDKPWYDTRYAWHYSIPDNKLMIYDYQLSKNLWKTGFNIAVRTEIVRKMKDTKKNNGIHKWMSNYVKDKYIDQTIYPCVATTGANTVSLNRRRHFNNPRPPFKKTVKTIRNIGLPEDIVKRLIGNNTISPLEIHRAQEKVEVEFLKSYCRLYKIGDIKRIPRLASERLLKKGHIRILSEPQIEPVNVEL